MHQKFQFYRKIEHDWNMVYLSRSPSTHCEDIGVAEWKFDVSKFSLISSVKLNVESTTFHSGIYLFQQIT